MSEEKTFPITHYAATFDAGRGKYHLFLQLGDGVMSELTVSSVEGFNAVLTMLRQAGVVWNAVEQRVELPVRPVGS